MDSSVAAEQVDYSVAERVHIMPVGYENSRVWEAAKGFKAYKVVLIGHNQNSPKGEECWKAVHEGLEERGFEFETETCDIFDLYDSLGTISGKISEYREDEVYVNVSTGSKITAIAGMISSMVLGAEAYYLKAKSYDEIPEGVEMIEELPHYPIEAPDKSQIVLLKFIERENDQGRYPTKGKLINVSEFNKLPFTLDNVQGKGKYRLLDINALNPLEEDDYIEIRKDGRNKIVEITEAGSAALRAFENLYDLSDIEWDPDKYSHEQQA